MGKCRMLVMLFIFSINDALNKAQIIIEYWIETKFFLTAVSVMPGNLIIGGV